MKAPDKIYVKPLLMEDGESIMGKCSEKPKKGYTIEYICKDALREWTNKMLQDTADRLDLHGNHAFMELYSKLNSM